MHRSFGPDNSTIAGWISSYQFDTPSSPLLIRNNETWVRTHLQLRCKGVTTNRIWEMLGKEISNCFYYIAGMFSKSIKTSVVFIITCDTRSWQEHFRCPTQESRPFGWFPPGNGIYFKWETECYNYNSIVYVMALWASNKGGLWMGHQEMCSPHPDPPLEKWKRNNS